MRHQIDLDALPREGDWQIGITTPVGPGPGVPFAVFKEQTSERWFWLERLFVDSDMFRVGMWDEDASTPEIPYRVPANWTL